MFSYDSIKSFLDDLSKSFDLSVSVVCLFVLITGDGTSLFISLALYIKVYIL